MLSLRRLLCSKHSKTIPARDLSYTVRQILLGDVQHQQAITVHGWIRSIRKQKSVSFVGVGDGTSPVNLQIVVDRTLIQNLRVGDSVRAVGTLACSPGRDQALELQALELFRLGACDVTSYPLQKNHHSLRHSRKHAHLRPREPTGLAVLRIRNALTDALHRWFRDRDFTHVNPPILTSNDCEGAGEVFRITTESALRQHQASCSVEDSKVAYDHSGNAQPETGSRSVTSIPEFFDRPAYLTVSTQLHLEALCAALSRVFTISPTFRAEGSQTHRHLSEFSMLEAEIAFIENLEDVMTVVEDSLKDALLQLKTNTSEEIELIWKLSQRNTRHPSTESGRSSNLSGNNSVGSWDDFTRVASLEHQWVRMTYAEAILELQKQETSRPGSFLHSIKLGIPLQSEHEKWLAGTLIGGPVFITDYPAQQKPFYMRLNPSDLTTDEKSGIETVACFDLLVPHVGELVGGSLREDRLNHLLTSMDMHGVDKGNMEWYLDLRRFGTFPHGGFGMGVERFISWITGIENIRDCTMFPRWSGSIVM